ncbi:hypothetical protein OSC27_01100 [Microbacterium sp. STN6]|uniref:NADH-quinone oxidoreductase subunit B family protein n=1 Tax=Microbacterium sp. STN6 TaxID=2995588 RepID=UPI002260CCA2|nr:hypothetical protein [Microbacterium sp. STN6]MCX7520868.1 hypothetical protein [Microbacterium sp. STN6]
MAWVTRGMRDGRLTTRWPAQKDGYYDEFATSARLRSDAPALADDEKETAAALCPTGAIAVASQNGETSVTLDRGRCVLCGRCVRLFPDTFEWETGTTRVASEAAALISTGAEQADDLKHLRETLAGKVRNLGRSVFIRHVDAGSDGSDEWEVQALANPVYDVHRLGIFFTASPRHADILLVTGIGAAGMTEPLRRTREAMPEPVVVIAAGADAVSGGLMGRSGYTGGFGAGSIIDVDVWVPGAPASPFALMEGILTAIDRLPSRRRERRGRT